MIFRGTTVAIAWLVTSVMLPREASATSCDIAGSIAAATRGATVIVVARVEHVTTPRGRVTEGPDGSITVSMTSSDPSHVVLTIEDSFKGSLPGRVEIDTPEVFVEGARYVIYGAERADRLVVRPCSRRRLVSDAAADLRYLDAVRAGAARGVIHGQVGVTREGPAPSPPLGFATIVLSSPDGVRDTFKADMFGNYEAVVAPGGYLVWVERGGRQFTNPERLDVAAGDQAKFFSVVTSPGDMEHDRVIAPFSMGPITLDMTLDMARREAPGAAFRRRRDRDGAALVEIVFGPGESLIVSANEESPDAPIDWTKKIRSIETFSTAFHIDGPIAPGALITDVVSQWGSSQRIVRNTIGGRQFVSFERQRPEFKLWIDDSGEFTGGELVTTRYRPDARILSIAISR